VSGDDILAVRGEVVVSRGGAWRTILHEQDIKDFYVEDDSGQVLVKVDYPDLSLGKDEGYRAGTFSESPPEVVAFLKAHGQKPTTGLGENRKLRYREGALVAGELVRVAGLVRQELSHEASASVSYRSTPLRPVLHKPAEGRPLHITDIVRSHP
jgi:hypothetical protein